MATSMSPPTSRGPDDFRDAGLQLRSRQGGGLDSLLACAGTAGGWPGSLVPFGDCQAIGAQIAGLLTDDIRRQSMRAARLCRQPIDDLGAHRRRLPAPCSRSRPRRHRLTVGSVRAADALPRLPRAGADAARSFPVHVRRHRPVPARGPFGSRPRPRLLHRRQCAGSAAGLRARSAGRTAPARRDDRALCRVCATRLEPRRQAVPQLHELRSALARGGRVRGQPWPSAMGVGRMRAERRQPVTPSVGVRPVRRGAAGSVESFASPRAWAFTLLGLDAYCAACAGRDRRTHASSAWRRDCTIA